MTAIVRWPALAGLGLVAVLGALLAGCSCNAPNTFDQRYCEAYSENTVVPAFIVGALFFGFTFLLLRFVRRRGASEDAAGTHADSDEPAASPAGDDPCAALERILAAGTATGRILERVDGQWAVELTLDPDRRVPPVLTAWSDRESACAAGLAELRRRRMVEG